MSSKTVPVPTVREGVEAGACRLEFATRAPWWIAVTLPDEGIVRGTGADLVAALGHVRARLRGTGLDLACEGSRADVHASPMMLESGGRHLYRTRMRVPARRADVVFLFRETPAGAVASFEERAAHHRAWLDSLAATAEERAEARSFPGGWIYRIDARFDPDGRVPPEGIIGAFEVDPDGDLTGLFVPNDGYRPEAGVPSTGIVPPRFDDRPG